MLPGPAREVQCAKYARTGARNSFRSERDSGAEFMRPVTKGGPRLTNCEIHSALRSAGGIAVSYSHARQWWQVQPDGPSVGGPTMPRRAISVAGRKDHRTSRYNDRGWKRTRV